jgi:GNAT superfamily N-acetyltransferase
MDFRLAVPADVLEMHRVRHSVRENVLVDAGSVTFKNTRRMLTRDGRGWVCEVEGRVVGIAIADLAGMNVWALFVEPGYEGMGIGRRLHDTMMDWMFESGATRVWLSTDPRTRAERFYARAGWEFAGRGENGETRFEMTRESWNDRRAGSGRTRGASA